MSLKHARAVLAATPLLFGCSFSLPPTVPAGPAVPVSFSAPSASEPMRIQVSGAGRKEQGCELPCAMDVPSGSALVTVDGPRKALLSTVIPAEPSRAEIHFQRRGQAIAGWIIAIAGVTAGSISLAVTRNAGADGQLKGAIAGGALSGLGLVGLIVALTSGKDEVRYTAAPAGAAPPSPN